MKTIVLVILNILINGEAKAMIYHLIRASDLSKSTKEEHIYEPSLEKEGFTHNATKTQIIPAANRHYGNVNDTLLLVIDEKRLDYPLQYDYVEKYNEYFPHIYGPINLSSIVRIFIMPKQADGTYSLPEDL